MNREQADSLIAKMVELQPANPYECPMMTKEGQIEAEEVWNLWVVVVDDLAEVVHSYGIMSREDFIKACRDGEKTGIMYD